MFDTGPDALTEATVSRIGRCLVAEIILENRGGVDRLLRDL